MLRDRVDYVSPHIIKAWIEAAAHAAEDLNIASPQPEWSLSLLNFNVLGCNLLSWEGAKFSQRMAEVLKLIRALSHDIVLIQEGWGEAGAALVRETRYPYTYSADKGGELLRGLIKGSGIHILSRFRILTARYCTFKRRPGLEWLGQKGYLVVEIDHPVAGRLRVVTGHFASPGEGIQRYLVSDRQTDLARLDNFQQMQNHLSMLEGADPCQTIIGGDFNVSNIHDERALSTLGDDV